MIVGRSYTLPMSFSFLPPRLQSQRQPSTTLWKVHQWLGFTSGTDSLKWHCIANFHLFQFFLNSSTPMCPWPTGPHPESYPEPPSTVLAFVCASGPSVSHNHNNFIDAPVLHRVMAINNNDEEKWKLLNTDSKEEYNIRCVLERQGNEVSSFRNSWRLFFFLPTQH